MQHLNNGIVNNNYRKITDEANPNIFGYTLKILS